MRIGDALSRGIASRVTRPVAHYRPAIAHDATSSVRVAVAGVALVADPAGALYWPAAAACSRSPTCISRKARASPRAACCCRLTTPRRRWRGWRG